MRKGFFSPDRLCGLTRLCPYENMQNNWTVPIPAKKPPVTPWTKPPVSLSVKSREKQRLCVGKQADEESTAFVRHSHRPQLPGGFRSSVW